MILRRYMNLQVATTTALVLGFLVVMLLGGRLIRYFGIAAEGGLNVNVLFTLIGYNLPYFLELILPLSFFIGLMLVLGRMYSDHEMAVLNGGGISRGALSRLLLPVVLLVFIVQCWITVVGKPWGVAKATNIWQEQSVIELFDMIRPKEFISSGDYHLYVGEVGENGEYLKDVIVISMNGKGQMIERPAAQNPEEESEQSEQTATPTDLQGKIPEQLISKKDAIIFAKSATQVHSTDGSIVLDLHEGRRYEVDTMSKQYSQVGFGRYRISIAGKNDKSTRVMKIEGMATGELLAINKGQIPYTPQEGKPNSVLAELGYRFSLPWLILIAVMLATPLATVRPRQGRWLKLIPAIFVFVAAVLILISLKESIAKGKMGIAVYPVAVLGFVLFALYLNYHERLMHIVRLNKATGEQ